MRVKVTGYIKCDRKKGLYLGQRSVGSRKVSKREPGFTKIGLLKFNGRGTPVSLKSIL